jgi:hypothetical protein
MTVLEPNNLLLLAPVRQAALDESAVGAMRKKVKLVLALAALLAGTTNAAVWRGLAEPAFDGSVESGCRFFVGQLWWNLVSAAVKMFKTFNFMHKDI